MASTYEGAITMIDAKALKTTLRVGGIFSGIDENDEFSLAKAALAALVVALGNVSGANVYKSSLTLITGGGTALPAGTDITDEAAVVCFLTAEGVAPKYHTLRIPAPLAAVFESDLITVDESNADVQAFVSEFGQEDVGWMVSDGEYVELLNENGISHGFWRSKAKSSQ